MPSDPAGVHFTGGVRGIETKMKWFKHETDAHKNLKHQAVIEKFGLEAYGYYWACDELVGDQGVNYRIKSEKDWKIFFKKFLNIEIDKQNKFLEFFSDKGLIDKKAFKKGDLYIPKLAERADEYTKRVRRVSEQDTDNVPLEEKRRDKKRIEETGRFAPPTILEVKNYCLERNNGVDPDKWHNFYSAKGWMVGKNKMKDWRAAVRTWEPKIIKPPTAKELPKVEKITPEQQKRNIKALEEMKIKAGLNKLKVNL